MDLRQTGPLGLLLALLGAVACADAGVAAAASSPAAAPAAPPATATAVGPPERLPVEAFGATPFLKGPTLSPDGTRLAARLNVRGKQMLGITYPLEASRTPAVIALPEGTDLRWVRWAGNERLLLGIGLETRWEGIELYITRLLAYDLPTGAVRPLGKRSEGIIGDDVLWVAEDGRQLLLSVSRDVFSYPDVVRIDIDTGGITKVVSQQSPIVDWYADHKGVVRLGIGYSNRKIRIVYRETDGEKFRVRPRLSFEDSDADIDTIRFRTQGSKGVVMTNVRTGRFALYDFDLETAEIGAPIFEHPEVDLDDFDLSEDGSRVTAVYYSDDRRRVLWLDPAMKLAQATVDKALPGRENWIVSKSRDARRLVVWSGAADDPGRIYFVDRDQRTLALLATPLESLEDKRLAPVQSVRYTSRDGLEIPAYLTLPVGREPRRLPLIVLPHGGPHLRDVWEFEPWVQFLANRGYAVLQPNFRGSAGFGKEFLAKGYGQWGGAMQDDLTDGVKWLAGQGTIDPARVCIMGASYGGYAAIMGTIKSPEVFRCGVSFAGVTDINDMLSYDRRGLLPARYRNWRRKVEGEQPLDLRSVSPLHRAGEVAAPLLIAHGRLDSTVPFRQAERFVKALAKAGKPHEYLAFDRIGHDFTSQDDQKRFLVAVEAFLDKHNPPGPPGAAPPPGAQAAVTPSR